MHLRLVGDDVDKFTDALIWLVPALPVETAADVGDWCGGELPFLGDFEVVEVEAAVYADGLGFDVVAGGVIVAFDVDFEGPRVVACLPGLGEDDSSAVAEVAGLGAHSLAETSWVAFAGSAVGGRGDGEEHGDKFHVVLPEICGSRGRVCNFAAGRRFATLRYYQEFCGSRSGLSWRVAARGFAKLEDYQRICGSDDGRGGEEEEMCDESIKCKCVVW